MILGLISWRMTGRCYRQIDIICHDLIRPIADGRFTTFSDSLNRRVQILHDLWTGSLTKSGTTVAIFERSFGKCQKRTFWRFLLRPVQLILLHFLHLRVNKTCASQWFYRLVWDVVNWSSWLVIIGWMFFACKICRRMNCSPNLKTFLLGLISLWKILVWGKWCVWVTWKRRAVLDEWIVWGLLYHFTVIDWILFLVVQLLLAVNGPWNVLDYLELHSIDLDVTRFRSLFHFLVHLKNLFLLNQLFNLLLKSLMFYF